MKWRSQQQKKQDRHLGTFSQNFSTPPPLSLLCRTKVDHRPAKSNHCPGFNWAVRGRGLEIPFEICCSIPQFHITCVCSSGPPSMLPPPSFLSLLKVRHFFAPPPLSPSLTTRTVCVCVCVWPTLQLNLSSLLPSRCVARRCLTREFVWPLFVSSSKRETEKTRDKFSSKQAEG